MPLPAASSGTRMRARSACSTSGWELPRGRSHCRRAAGRAIPAQDIPELKQLGVAAVFTPGAPTSDIIEFIRGAVTP